MNQRTLAWWTDPHPHLTPFGERRKQIVIPVCDMTYSQLCWTISKMQLTITREKLLSGNHLARQLVLNYMIEELLDRGYAPTDIPGYHIKEERHVSA